MGSPFSCRSHCLLQVKRFCSRRVENIVRTRRLSNLYSSLLWCLIYILSASYVWAGRHSLEPPYQVKSTLLFHFLETERRFKKYFFFSSPTYIFLSSWIMDSLLRLKKPEILKEILISLGDNENTVISNNYSHWEQWIRLSLMWPFGILPTVSAILEFNPGVSPN